MPLIDLIQIRGGTSTEWFDANPVLSLHEPGLESDTRRLKAGDGVTAWNDLQYVGGTGSGGGGIEYYETEAALIAAHPTGNPGDKYLVGTDPITLWTWDQTNTEYVNTGNEFNFGVDNEFIPGSYAPVASQAIQEALSNKMNVGGPVEMSQVTGLLEELLSKLEAADIYNINSAMFKQGTGIVLTKDGEFITINRSGGDGVSGDWGSIGGDITAQTDLITELLKYQKPPVWTPVTPSGGVVTLPAVNGTNDYYEYTESGPVTLAHSGTFEDAGHKWVRVTLGSSSHTITLGAGYTDKEGVAQTEIVLTGTAGRIKEFYLVRKGSTWIVYEDAGSGTGEGLPAGGTTGQVLKKQSDTDGDADWEDETGGSGGENPVWSTAVFNGTGGTTTALDLQNLNNPGVYFEANAAATILALENVKTGETTKIKVELQILFDGITDLAVTFPANFYEEGILIEDPIALTAPVDTIQTYQLLKRGTDWEFFRGGAGGEAGAETTASIGTLINNATVKDTPVDADLLALTDSTASHILRKLSWLAIKAALKTYFDTIYTGGGGGSTTFANQTEVNTGTEAAKAIAPNTLAGWWTGVKAAIQTISAKWTFSVAPNLSSLTASRPLKLNASKDVTADYIAVNEIAAIGAWKAIGNGTSASAQPTELDMVELYEAFDDTTIVNTNYTLTAADRDLQVDTTAPRTITLDGTGSKDGKKVTIFDDTGSAGTNNITIAAAGGQTIVGNALINANGGSRTYIWNGTSKWILIAST